MDATARSRLVYTRSYKIIDLIKTQVFSTLRNLSSIVRRWTSLGFGNGQLFLSVSTAYTSSILLLTSQSLYPNSTRTGSLGLSLVIA